ncbi:hypothetical protein GCM10017556_31750 [Micromonospora sagamiensis]|nr:hypothetical protein GCM10017556_31750 [Micromonospora sagamiensis]
MLYSLSYGGASAQSRDQRIHPGWQGVAHVRPRHPYPCSPSPGPHPEHTNPGLRPAVGQGGPRWHRSAANRLFAYLVILDWDASTAATSDGNRKRSRSTCEVWDFRPFLGAVDPRGVALDAGSAAVCGAPRASPPSKAGWVG